MKNDALDRAIDIAGGQSQLARAIGTRQQYVWKWLRQRNGRVPAEFVLAIEKATDVSRHDLRPDIYPIEGRVRSRRAA